MADQRIETIGQALRGVLSDPMWLKRSFVGAAVSLVPYLGMVWVTGYELHYQRDVAYGGGERLPEWKLADPQLRTGLYAWVVGLAYSLPLSVLLTLGMIVPIFLGVMSARSSGDVGWLVGGVAVSIACVMFASAFFGLVLWPVYTHVQLYDSIGAGFEFKRIFGLMKEHKSAYWTTAGRALLLSLLSTVVVLIAMGISMGGTLALAVAVLPFEQAMGLWGMLATPAQLVLNLPMGLVTIPLTLAVFRLWAGYARIAYGLDSLPASQPQTVSE